MIDRLFDRVFVVSMASSDQRRTHIADHFAEIGLTSYEFFDAVIGAVCTIVNDHRNGVLHGGADPRRPAYVLGW